MKILLRFSLMFMLGVLVISVQAQDAFEEPAEKPDLSGWDFGMGFGMYIPPAYHANFYNGSENNINKLSYVFGNKYWYDEISNALNSSDTIVITGMPTAMKYTPAFSFGLYFRKTYNNDFGFSVQVGYSKLYANDFFQVEVDPNIILTEPDYRLFPIWGIEERVNIDLNFSRYFPRANSQLIPFFEGGININSTRVKENKIAIENLTYSLIDVYLNGSYVPGMQQNEYVVQQGGMSWGINAGGGVKMIFNEMVSVDPGLTLYYQKINLEGYREFRPGLLLYVRLSMNAIFLLGAE